MGKGQGAEEGSLVIHTNLGKTKARSPEGKRAFVSGASLGGSGEPSSPW
jgi:hypothetical protein